MSSACGPVSFMLERRGLYVAVLLFKNLWVGIRACLSWPFGVDRIGRRLDDTTMRVKCLLTIKTIKLFVFGRAGNIATHYHDLVNGAPFLFCCLIESRN